MAEATLTSKGQVTIPKAVREAMGLKEGDRVDFIETDRGVLMTFTLDRAAAKLARFRLLS